MNVNMNNNIDVIYIDIDILTFKPYILGLKNFYKVKIYVIFDKKFSLFLTFRQYKMSLKKRS